MTEGHQMQQPSDNIHNMFAHESGETGPSHGNHVETQRSTDPRNSLEDYNRTMLEYTQRQMSSFVDIDDNNSGNSGSSRSSQSSGNSGRSGTSSNGVLARQANGAPPTSASAAAAATRHAAHQHHG
ncbi:uncharacterized protein N7473_003575 [Penicillium subrubescens]|uniref:Uncharacterized protein n=1 Tax=Penicillium subrubescens TaxID=1316194 RepID=A0A1Q5TLD5_9EURO|nr:uncharacterized protein N7473_003575 [Penicillium subrubescens]KAJ5906659.1 hypothetical protein N7473_003575 [Penicillium subrubescens]OKP01032.1 hypothetical protein PENSUB_7613 [Penicillium subrubescens]